jgi:hypothetical protein
MMITNEETIMNSRDLKTDFDLYSEYGLDGLWYLYERKSEKDIVCQLCEGQHGNNTNCQRNDQRNG